MDEPLGPLDPVSADELWIELNNHRNDGMTILLSSHQLPAEAYPDRYFIMEQGEIIAQGTPRPTAQVAQDSRWAADAGYHAAGGDQRPESGGQCQQRLNFSRCATCGPFFWLRWKQFLDSAVYWMRLLGYQPGEPSFLQRIYVVYLLGIGSIWVFAMWAWGFDVATNIGTSLASQTLGELLVMIPLVVLALQVFAMVIALRSTPLKLSFSDMAYLAGSPVARSVPVLLGFIRQVLFRIVVFGALWTLITIVLLGPMGVEATAGDSFRVAAVVALMVVFTWATAWLLGILRLVFPQVSRIPLLWALPLLLAARCPGAA